MFLLVKSLTWQSRYRFPSNKMQGNAVATLLKGWSRSDIPKHINLCPRTFQGCWFDTSCRYFWSAPCLLCSAQSRKLGNSPATSHVLMILGWRQCFAEYPSGERFELEFSYIYRPDLWGLGRPNKKLYRTTLCWLWNLLMECVLWRRSRASGRILRGSCGGSRDEFRFGSQQASLLSRPSSLWLERCRSCCTWTFFISMLLKK